MEKETKCEYHQWDRTDKPIYFESDSGSTTGYLDVICADCGKKGREVYNYEETEEAE